MSDELRQSTEHPAELTVLLREYRAGDAGALERAAAMLYPQLKALAVRRSRNGPGMGATTLVQETFLELLSGGTLQPQDRRQFLALSATVMRRVIIDEIRYLTADKRRGREYTLAETVMGDDAHERAEFLLLVDQVLDLLEQEDARLAQVFECRYFAGLTTAETAEALSFSERTVERFWSRSRARIAELIDDSRA